MLILSHSEVLELLPMGECMTAVGEALIGLARGEGVQPLRGGFLLPDRRGVLAWMPGSLAAGGVFGVKVLSVVEDPGALGVDSHQGGVLIFDAADGSPLALLEAGAITAVRTAAVSALATDRLARPEAATLAILGAGTQARSHIEAMLEVRPIERIRLWSRDRGKAERFAAEQVKRHGVPVDVEDDAPSAVAGADIVCTTTSAREPILEASALEPGMHVNAVGASIPSWREIEPGVLALVTLFTDRRESLANEAGEYIQAVEEGLGPAGLVVPEIGEVLNGDHPGRTSETEITLFRSLGLAVEDLAAGRLVSQRARELGVGTEIELNGCADNPLFLPEEDIVLTGANFQGTPVSMPLDMVGAGITMVSVLSERRLNRLLHPALSVGLPAFLTKGAGMFSGLMLSQYTADMLIVEQRILSTPSCIQSIPAAADQEDFVSMGMNGALKSRQILDNAHGVLAIEAIGAAQALDFREHGFGKGVNAAHAAIRQVVEHLRYFPVGVAIDPVSELFDLFPEVIRELR